MKTPPLARCASGSFHCRPRVLVVDDEPAIGRSLAMLLSDAYSVEAVTSAKDALGRLLYGERYDVIVSDVSMPAMTGVDLHDEVGRHLPAHTRRIVFMTGGVADSGLRRRLDRLPNVVLDKPVDLDTLRSIIDIVHAGREGVSSARSA